MTNRVFPVLSFICTHLRDLTSGSTCSCSSPHSSAGLGTRRFGLLYLTGKRRVDRMRKSPFCPPDYCEIPRVAEAAALGSSCSAVAARTPRCKYSAQSRVFEQRTRNQTTLRLPCKYRKPWGAPPQTHKIIINRSPEA